MSAFAFGCRSDLYRETVFAAIVPAFSLGGPVKNGESSSHEGERRIGFIRADADERNRIRNRRQRGIDYDGSPWASENYLQIA